jgi:hypothetical protein
MFDLEFDDPNYGICDCCGNKTISLTRYVSRDGEARAVYFAAFTEGHPERRVQVSASLGIWGENADPATRVTFVFEIWSDDQKINVGIIDGKHSLWFQESGIFGRFLSRGEALVHPWIDEVFSISDAIVDKDRPIREFLEGEAQN